MSASSLSEFAKDVLQVAFDGHDLDGGEIEALGVKYGLLRTVAYDPAKHGETSFNIVDGDEWYELSSVFDAPSAVPAVEVVGLEWLRTPLTEFTSRAETPCATYVVWSHHEAGGLWFGSIEDGKSRDATEYASEHAAKAAAQADFERRVTSCIATRIQAPLVPAAPAETVPGSGEREQQLLKRAKTAERRLREAGKLIETHKEHAADLQQQLSDLQLRAFNGGLR